MNKEVLISMVNSGKIRFIPLRKCFLCNEYEDRLYYENGDVYVEPLNEIA